MNRHVSSWGGLAAVILRGGLPATLGCVAASQLPAPVDVVAVATCALLATAWLHEAGHVAAYWIICGRPEPVTMRVSFGIATSVVVDRPDLAPRRVALAGPLAPALLAFPFAAIGIGIGNSALAAVAVSCGIHLLGVVPGCSDGNRIWSLTEG